MGRSEFSPNNWLITTQLHDTLKKYFGHKNHMSCCVKSYGNFNHLIQINNHHDTYNKKMDETVILIKTAENKKS